MDQASIAEDLNTFIRAKYEIGEDDPDFDMEVHLFDYGYIDSFGAVALTTFVEEKYGIKVSDADLVVHPLNTIHEIADFISKRKAGVI